LIIEVLYGSLSGVTARRRAPGMAVALAKRDNTAVVPDRLRRSGLAGEPTVLDGFKGLPRLGRPAAKRLVSELACKPEYFHN